MPLLTVPRPTTEELLSKPVCASLQPGLVFDLDMGVGKDTGMT